MLTSHLKCSFSADFAKLWQCINDKTSTTHTLLDAGWFAAIAMMILQLTTNYMPTGEVRDWTQYFLVGGWAASYLAIGVLSRLYTPSFYDKIYPCINVIKCGLTAYAVIALSYYFIAPVLQVKLWWAWVLSGYIAIRFSTKDGRLYLPGGISIMWLLLCAFSLFFALLYQNPIITIPTTIPALYYATPFIISLLFIVLVLIRKSTDGRILPVITHKPVRFLLHIIAFYTILLPTLRSDSIADGTTIHHWKAFLEFAASVRAGGWLLWDTPSQYGFLQTILLAFMPTATTWQSFYLLNGILQLLVGYAIFFVLFAKYRSIAGFVFSLSLAAACSIQMIPATITMLIYPSTGMIRFFWVYAMVGYVFYCCFNAIKNHQKPISNRLLMTGNCLWLFAALWSVESAIYTTIVWLPSLFFIACGEISAMQPRADFHRSIKHLLSRLLPPVIMATILFVLICIAYLLHCGHLPDFALLTAYTTAYQTFMAYPMTALAVLPCWLAVFFMLAMFLKNVISTLPPGRQSGFHIAALYSATFSIWACAAYYVPFSENFHITGTLSLLVFGTALTLLLLPSLSIPTSIKLAFEKGAFCLYAIIILGTVSHFNYGIYTQRNFLSPIEGDVTRMLPVPHPDLQSLIAEAAIPNNASVQVIYASVLESVYIHTPGMKPWLLPNTFVGFKLPLSPTMFQTLAERRAQTADEYGWVIEANDFPLEALPWLQTAILKTYTPVATFNKGIFRIRKFKKL